MIQNACALLDHRQGERQGMSRTIFAADLFCGAGGTSTGLLKAAERLGCTKHKI